MSTIWWVESEKEAACKLLAPIELLNCVSFRAELFVYMCLRIRRSLFHVSCFPSAIIFDECLLERGCHSRSVQLILKFHEIAECFESRLPKMVNFSPRDERPDRVRTKATEGEVRRAGRSRDQRGPACAGKGEGLTAVVRVQKRRREERVESV